MKYIKVPFLGKGIIFFVFIISFIITTVITQNFFGIINLLHFATLLCSIILFYYVLKNNLFASKLFSFLFLLNIFWIGQFLHDISSLNIIKNYLIYLYLLCAGIYILILFSLFAYNKKIKKGIETPENKDITMKKQSVYFLVSFFIISIFISIFNFGYYSTPKNIENIETDFFITKYNNITDIPEQNLYTDMENKGLITKINETSTGGYNGDKYRYLKTEMVECLYKNNCSLTLKEYQNNINNSIATGKNTDSDNEIIQDEKVQKISYLQSHIDLLYEFSDEESLNEYIDFFIEQLGKDIYYKTDIYENYIYTDFLVLNRDMQYKIIYYLNNNEETQAVQLLRSQIKIANTILEGENSLIGMQVAMSILNSKQGLFSTMNLILDNYELSKKSKIILGNAIKNDIRNDIFKNSLINEYKVLSFYLSGILPDNHGTTLLLKDETEKAYKEIYYNLIINNGEIPDDIKEKYQKINFFKNNIMGQIILKDLVNTSYSDIYNKFLELNNSRKILIERLK